MEFEMNSDTKKKAFVTGSTGLLGNNLIRELLSQGWQVKALVRSATKAKESFGDLIDNTSLTIITGDMESVASIRHDLTDCDALFHAAAYFRDSFQPGQHFDKMRNINVDCTIELLKLADQQGVKKVVYVSSTAVFKDGMELSPTNEPHSRLSDETENDYYRSKILAEIAIGEFLKQSKLPVIYILPGFMHGPGDIGPTSAGRNVLDYLNGKLPGFVDATMSVVDARDVSQAMITAVKKGITGERYLVGGRTMSFPKIYSHLEQVTGIPAPTKKVPYWFLYFYGWLNELYAKLTKKEVQITRHGARLLKDKNYYDSSKSIAEVDVHFRPFHESINDTVKWYQSNGFVGVRSKAGQ